MTQRESGQAGGAEEAGKRRVFVGVPVPEDLHPFIRRAQDGLEPVADLRLLRPEQFHVTLAFIGSAGEPALRVARDVVAEIPTSLGGWASLGGILPLPSARRARVVALEVEDAGGVFAGLFEHVMGGLERAGVMEREKRPFRPHLTIARLRRPASLRPKTDMDSVRYPVGSVCLYESRLRPKGAEYEALECRSLEV